MSNLSVLCCCLVLATSLCVSAEDNNGVEEEVEVVDRNTLPLKIPTELPANVMQLVATAGAVVLGVVAVALVLALVLPLFGVKLCYLLGTCDHITFISPAGGVGQGYDAYSNTATFNNPNPAAYASTTYQRRSLEYVGPILKALSSAYDKYATPYLAKKN